MEPSEMPVNATVRQLADYLGMDPKVAQELYLQSGLGDAIDGLEQC